MAVRHSRKKKNECKPDSRDEVIQNEKSRTQGAGWEEVETGQRGWRGEKRLRRPSFTNDELEQGRFHYSTAAGKRFDS